MCFLYNSYIISFHKHIILLIICRVDFFSVLFEKGRGTLKEQISAIKPILEELRSKKQERIKEFSEIQSQVVWICTEIAGNGQSNLSSDPQVSESDLTMKKLGELKSHLLELQNEKVASTIVIQR